MLGFLVLYIFLSVMYLTLGLSIISKDSQWVNRFFALLAINLSVLSALNGWCLIHMNLYEGTFVYRLLILLWTMIYFWLFVFIIFLTEHRDWINGLWKKIAIALPTMITIYIYTIMPITQQEFIRIIKGQSLFQNIGHGYFYNTYFYLYSIISIGFCLFLLGKWYRKSTLTREKRQAKIIFLATVCGLVVGILLEYFLPSLYEIYIDPLAVAVIAIPCVAIAYSMWKYKLMNANPKNLTSNIFELMNEGIIVLNEKGMIQYANNGANRLLKYEINELLNKHISLITINDSEDFKINNIKSQELSLTTQDHQIITVLLSSTISLDSCGEILSIVLIFQDLSEIKQIQHKIMDLNYYLEKRVADRTNKLNDEISRRIEVEKNIINMANHDYLTGLPNRRCLVEKFNNRASIEDEIAIIYMDIDSFKNINDTLGHTIGDEVLIEISKRLDHIIHEPDIVARIGGDEFLLFLNISEGQPRLMEKINQIIKSFEKPIELRREKINVTSSMGVACFPADGKDFETLMKNADISLYQAKAEGKNRYVVCNERLKEKVNEELRLTNNLFKALQNDEIIAYYQPKVNHITGDITGFEALARWQHSESLIISPGKFIPIAEKTGLIVDIGEHILRTACQQMKIWVEEGHDQWVVSVNISVIQIRREDFIKRIKRILAETRLAPQYLELEVTESLLIKNSDQIINTLIELKAIGVKISMDDFGTEYSSLRYLKYLPIDRIKIDREFVSHININDKDEKIIKSTIELIKNLGFEVIAEGVETLEQAEFLRKLGCVEIQGYYYYKPMPVEKIESIIKEKYMNVSSG
jgi:diguanylate cyclase (GGDEF)-like protein/PAS domain S-box-containing protein